MQYRNQGLDRNVQIFSVVDRHRFVDPYPTLHFNADPDQTFHFDAIRIQLSILLPIRSFLGANFYRPGSRFTDPIECRSNPETISYNRCGPIA